MLKRQTESQADGRTVTTDKKQTDGQIKSSKWKDQREIEIDRQERQKHRQMDGPMGWTKTKQKDGQTDKELETNR